MRRILLTLLAMSLLAVPAAFGGQSSGCGLGSELFDGSSGMIANLLAATTNQSTYTQYFGISSGTSGCDANHTVKLEQAREEFVAVNYENLSEDMARGEGEYVQALAALFGCAHEARPAFADLTRQHYPALMSEAGGEASALVHGVQSRVQAQPVLANRCSAVS